MTCCTLGGSFYQFPSTATPHGKQQKVNNVQYCQPVLHQKFGKKGKATFQLGPHQHSRLLDRNAFTHRSKDAFLFRGTASIYCATPCRSRQAPRTWSKSSVYGRLLMTLLLGLVLGLGIVDMLLSKLGA